MTLYPPSVHLYPPWVHPVPIDDETYTHRRRNLYPPWVPKYIEVLRSTAYGRGSLRVAPGLGLNRVIS